jgi:hypothetical protein
MISKPIENPIVAISVKIYRALLVAYPTKFQQEYGSHMLQVFRDCCLRTFRQSGTNGMFRLWAITLFDLVQSVVSEHAHKEIEMKKEMKPRDIRMAGWALMAGSVVFGLGMFIGSLQNDNWYVMIALVALISMPLLAFGLLGLRRRYGDQVGVFGKNILLIGAIFGSLVSIIGYFGEVGLFGKVFYEIWVLILAGPIVLFACLALFGMAALFKKPLPRWNMVPIIAGAWYPIFFLAYFIISVRTGDWDSFEAGAPEWFVAVAATLLIMQGVALVALGYILKSDVPEETLATA